MNFHKNPNSHPSSFLVTVTVTLALVFLWTSLCPHIVGCDLLSVAESKDETETSPIPSEGTAGINFGTPPNYDSDPAPAHGFSIHELPKINIDQINKFMEQHEEEDRGNRNIKIIDSRDRDPSVNSNKSFSFSLSERKRWKIYFLLFASLVLLSGVGCCTLCCKDRTSSSSSSSSQESTEMSIAVPVPVVEDIEDPSQHKNQEQLVVVGVGVGVDVACGGGGDSDSPLILRNNSGSGSGTGAGTAGESDSQFGNPRNNLWSEKDIDCVTIFQ